MKDPTKGIDCPDVIPLKFSNNIHDREAMKNESPLVHPDAKGLTKYCLGTGLQMRKGKKSHQLKTCEYHDADNCAQGKLLSTMTQEAMQVIQGVYKIMSFLSERRRNNAVNSGQLR